MHSSILNLSSIQKHILSHIEFFSPFIISYLECLIWAAISWIKYFLSYMEGFYRSPFLIWKCFVWTAAPLFLSFLSYFEFFLHMWLSYIEVFPQTIHLPDHMVPFVYRILFFIIAFLYGRFLSTTFLFTITRFFHNKSVFSLSYISYIEVSLRVFSSYYECILYGIPSILDDSSCKIPFSYKTPPFLPFFL